VFHFCDISEADITEGKTESERRQTHLQTLSATDDLTLFI
jgi:hypothetical protein